MSIIDNIQKLIAEHASAAVLSQHLSFAKEQYADLERKASDLQKQLGHLEAQLEREQAENKQTKQELQQLKDEHAEEVIIHKLIEFRRGKRTRGKWLAFCPKCHMPAGSRLFNGRPSVYCSGECGWIVLELYLDNVVRELDH
jgi:hypothetical protein